MIFRGHGVAHLQGTGLARGSVTGTCPNAFEYSAGVRRWMLESGLRRLCQIVDTIAIPIGTREAKIGSGTGVEDEALIRVRRPLLRQELQPHGDMGRARGKLAKQGRGNAATTQSCRSILKSGCTLLGRRVPVS